MGHSPVDPNRPANDYGNACWLVALAVVAALLALRAHANPSPIYGGDEYAYFANGLFRSNPAEIWQRDAHLQRIINPLFLALVDHSTRVFPDPVGAVRSIATLSYLGMIGLAGWYVSRRAGSLHAAAMVIIAGLLPSTGYAAALMPEVIFFAVAIVAVLAMAGTVAAPGAIVAAAATAAALLLKPHAVSLLLGIVVARILLAVFSVLRGLPWTSAIASLATYLAACYLFLIASSLLFFRRLSLDPRFLLGDFYGSAARTSLDTAGSGLSSIASYAWANAAGVVLLAFPLLGVIALQARRCLLEGNALSQRQSLDLPLITLCVGGATIAMVSVFTYGAGVYAPSEAYRLHGRYYAHLYVLLAISALCIPHWRKLLLEPVSRLGAQRLDGFRGVGIAWLVAIPLCLLTIWQFQILPWDNPELQALYRNDLATWNSPVHVRWFAIAAPAVLVLAALAFIACRRLAAPTAVAAIALVFAMSMFNNTRFQYFQIASSQYLTEAGRFARDLFPRGEDARVVVVGTDRYGAMAYTLFGMACRCHVFVADEGKPVSKTTLPAGVHYVFSVRSHPLDFPAELLFKAPAGSFYRLGD